MRSKRKGKMKTKEGYSRGERSERVHYKGKSESKGKEEWKRRRKVGKNHSGWSSAALLRSRVAEQ
jgi:hypothetical protein